MKNESVLYTFEFELTADILSKLTCKSSINEIWDGNALDLTGNKAPSDIRHSVSLVKTEISYPKFVFQIFSEKLLKDASQQSEKEDQKSTFDNFQQTDEQIKASFEHLSQQTDPKLHSDIHQQTEVTTDHSESQTTIQEFSDNGIQTATSDCLSTASNTTESRMLQNNISTLTEQNLGSLRDAESMVEVERSDSTCQAASEMSEKACQNSVESCHALMQTCPLISDSAIQTDEQAFTSLEVQTACSMANETHTAMQASSEMAEKETQMSIETCHTDSQTINGCIHSIEEETQAGVLMESDEAQTEADVVDQDTSTEHNLLSQRSTTTQACIEMLSQAQQTTIYGLNFSDQSILKQMESEDERLNTSQLQSDVDPPKTFLNSTLDHSVDTSFSLAAIRNDIASQTDPVTIIIGDASFLVQKLKSSAVNSSKVTTSGNEIEIELSVDNDAVKNEPMTDQKQQQQQQQNRQQQQKKPQQQPILNKQQQQQQKTPQQQQQLRDRSQQQQQQQSALKPRMGGGVRMRMPVSTPTTPRINNHPSIRPTTPIHSPKPTSKAPSTEALFSCPFCSLNFSESPALYEHLSQAHKSDSQSNWRKSQGREGKTIVPRQNQTPKSGNKRKTPGVTPSGSGTTLDSPTVVSEGATKRKAVVAEGSAKILRLEGDAKAAVK